MERVFQTQAQEDHSTKQRCKRCLAAELSGFLLTIYPDWSEESLRGHVENIHPNLASSKSIIQLLWRSFYFFAFHPFPQDPTGGRVDWEAFQRAISMLVAQGADLLGVLEEIESFGDSMVTISIIRTRSKESSEASGLPNDAPKCSRNQFISWKRLPTF